VDNTGLGNLVIGYNEDSFGAAPPIPPGFAASFPQNIDANRTGSHNLVVGPDNMFTGSGGLVAGAGNMISGKYATVTGGECNMAGPSQLRLFECLLPATGGLFSPGEAATVSGGFENTAIGVDSSIGGSFGVPVNAFGQNTN